VSVNTITSYSRAIRDIVEGRPADAVKPWVNEAKRPFADPEASAVERSEDPSDGGGGG
jgi:hypothetical protein